jgi:hypothetical protein
MYGSSTSGSEGAKIVEEEGRDMPNTVSENGSLYPPGIALISTFSSGDDMDASLVLDRCRTLPVPILDCFFLSTFDRGLSIVDAEEPEMRDGVRALSGTSSFGRRDEEVCIFDLDAGTRETAWVIGTVAVVLPWRRTATEGFEASARWPAACLLGCDCSYPVGSFFCNFAAGSCVAAVGVTERCGRRVVVR